MSRKVWLNLKPKVGRAWCCSRTAWAAMIACCFLLFCLNCNREWSGISGVFFFDSPKTVEYIKKNSEDGQNISISKMFGPSQGGRTGIMRSLWSCSISVQFHVYRTDSEWQPRSSCARAVQLSQNTYDWIISKSCVSVCTVCARLRSMPIRGLRDVTYNTTGLHFFFQICHKSSRTKS